MKLPKIEALLVPASATIREAIEAINKNKQAVAFVVDAGSKLVGAVTDGDLRRALLRKLGLDDPISSAMNRNFVARPVTVSIEEINSLLSERIRHIPLLDEAGRPVDYACWHRHHRTPVAEPSLGGNELLYLTECVRTNWISSNGRFILKFEKKFAEFCESPHALAVSNGTVALHLAMLGLGVGPGDEVIVPDLTFAACAGTVYHAGAAPVLVDIDPKTWTLDASKVEGAITPKTKAIMSVHLYGHPCDMDPLMALAKRHGLFLIEDCAEALGARYKGRPVGSFGDAATFSFFGNKTVTTGEGGMILFNDADARERAVKLRDHGMDRKRRYWHDVVGFNYRLTNLQAAVGVAQMERVDELMGIKRRIAEVYVKALSSIPGLVFPPSEAWATNTCWLFTFLLPEAYVLGRDKIIEKLLLNGVETRPVFFPLHEMPPYSGCGKPSAFPVSKRVSRAGLSLPSSINLTEEEQHRIGKVIASVLRTSDLAQMIEFEE